LVFQRKYKVLVFIVCIFCQAAGSQILQLPSAKFTFNDNSNYNEISPGLAPRLIGVNYTEDRFGNANNALYIFGNEYSYINLGNYKAIKPVKGTISLWVKIERIVFSGSGYKANPILLTKGRANDDFYEAYGIYYTYDRNKIVVNTARDSLRQITITSKKEFSLFNWHHLVLSYDNDFFSFYIDGVLERKEVKNFETKFLASDSVLIGLSANKKNKRFTEAAIDDIEFYDRVLSDEEVLALYNAPNPNKYTLLFNAAVKAILAIMVLFGLYLLLKYQLSITLKKEKKQLELDKLVLETELRVNRALMNPHLVFNSLSTLQGFILENEIEQANNYLVRFSKLIRKILDGNIQDMITLEQEIELLTSYLEVENLRFEENIQCTIELDPLIKAAAVYIPIMMLQPFIENAIWHGLLKKEGTRTLRISFSAIGRTYLKCIIEDNGVGRRKSLRDIVEKRSLSTGFILQRLTLLNKIHNLECTLSIEDKEEDSGTVVILILPVLKS
jgi:hypothetical protein